MLQDGKTYPLCPLCYNYPPFEGVGKVMQAEHVVDNLLVDAFTCLQGSERRLTVLLWHQDALCAQSKTCCLDAAAAVADLAVFDTHDIRFTLLYVLRVLLQVGVGGGSSTKLGMPCTTCLHPTCKHSPAQQGVLSCPECR